MSARDEAMVAAGREWNARAEIDRTFEAAEALFARHGFTHDPRGWTMPSGRRFVTSWETIPGTYGHPYLTIEVARDVGTARRVTIDGSGQSWLALDRGETWNGFAVAYVDALTLAQICAWIVSNEGESPLPALGADGLYRLDGLALSWVAEKEGGR